VGGSASSVVSIVCRAQQDETVDSVLGCDNGFANSTHIDKSDSEVTRFCKFKWRRNTVEIPTSSITFRF